MIEHKFSECICLLYNTSEWREFKTVGEAAELGLNATDGRKGYSTKFKYCPECGKKIDWRLIRAIQREAQEAKDRNEYNICRAVNPWE